MSLSATMRERRSAKKASLDALLASVETRDNKDMTDEESTQFDAIVAEIRSMDARIVELDAVEASEARAAATRVEAGETGEQRTGGAQVTEKPIYQKGDHTRSFFRDLHLASNAHDTAAAERIRRNHAIEAGEQRALGNTGAVGGSGGEFAPPAWLVSDAVMLARPGRVAADLFTHASLPAGISSVNIPRVATGTTTAIQTTQNSALSQTDLTTNSLASNITTVGGKQVVSLQLLEQSAIGLDSIILQDLALAYATSLDVQALTGSGSSGQLRGLANAAGLTSQTYTQATPAVAGAGGLYSNLIKAQAAVYGTRYMAPDTVLMHPRRWAFICASFDSNNRPLVVPRALAMNPVATDDVNVAQGHVGNIAGMDVFVDPSIPVNLGAGTNQDVIYVFKRSDVWLWESELRAESFTQPYADTMGVLFRLFAYSALIPDRYGSSIVAITGTGTVTPTF
jgi:HK97 family phage major capsid protein